MQRFIYSAVVLFLFGTGFLNLDGNEWNPVDVPSFLSGETGERVLSSEEWEDILVGEWEFVSDFGYITYKGKVTYDAKGTFVRKISYLDDSNEYPVRSGGTVRGTWSKNTDSDTWLELSEKCTFSNIEESLCATFSEANYGEIESDIWDYRVVYFNHSKIVIRAEHLSGEGSRVYRFDRIE